MSTSIAIEPNSSPIDIFEAWLKEAKSHAHIREATAMALSTADKNGDLSTRIVLCKQWSARGFVFFTNYQSSKGLDLAQNPRAAATFYWDPLARQVRISGDVQKTTRAESEAYWRSRPRESQLSQVISRQSETVASREVMEQLWKEMENKMKGQEIPCPPHWGGYVLRPKRIEFWVGQTGRLHDRYLYEVSDNHWTFRRLYP